MAGATFMAAGSSAPELFTSTMSLVSDNATNELGVATIVGSAVFNILIIVAATVIFSGETHLALDWRPVTRDCAFYAVSIAFVMGVMWDGKVYWWEGVVSVCLYLVRRIHDNKRERDGLMERVARGFRRRTLGNKIASFREETREETDDLERSVVELSCPEDDKAGGNDGTVDDEDEANNPFAVPDDWRKYPMWALSLPWYAAFTVTVPDCGKTGWERWYLYRSFPPCCGYPPSPTGWSTPPRLSAASSTSPRWSWARSCSPREPPSPTRSPRVRRAGWPGRHGRRRRRSNVFDIWLGLGLPWLVFLPARGGFEEVSTAQLWPSVCILAGVLLVYYASLVFTGFRLKRSMGYAYVLVYGLFVVYSVVGVWWMDVYDLRRSE